MKLGIVINTEKERVLTILPDFLEWLHEKKYEFVVNADAREILHEKTSSATRFLPMTEIVKEADLLVSFGGDGTLLSVARMIGKLEKPILGVNVGKLGFLTEIDTQDLHTAMERLRTSWYKIEKRLVLELKLPNGKIVHALNDAVIFRGDAGRLIHVSAHVGEEFLTTYIADGLIVASPTGSTAYSLSSNGPILSPTIEAMVVNPICPHTLTMRPLVVSSREIIRLTLREGDRGIIMADGQNVGEMKAGDEIHIVAAGHFANLIRFGERNFFDVLRSKLHWGEDGRI